MVAEFSDRHRRYGKVPSKAALMVGWTMTDRFAANNDLRTVQALYSNAQEWDLATWYDRDSAVEEIVVTKLRMSEPESNSAPSQQLSLSD